MEKKTEMRKAKETEPTQKRSTQTKMTHAEVCRGDEVDRGT